MEIMKTIIKWLLSPFSQDKKIKQIDPVAHAERLLKKGGIKNLKLANKVITEYLPVLCKISYAAHAADSVLHIFEADKPRNKRPRKAIMAAHTVASDYTEENRSKAAVCYSDTLTIDHPAATAAAYAAAAGGTPAFQYADVYAEDAVNAALEATTDKQIRRDIITFGLEMLNK